VVFRSLPLWFSGGLGLLTRSFFLRRRAAKGFAYFESQVCLIGMAARDRDLKKLYGLWE